MNNKYQRRERSLVFGVMLWAVIASAAASLNPEVVRTVLLATKPLTTIGLILVSIGLCGGVADAIHLAVLRWLRPESTQTLIQQTCEGDDV